MTILPTAQRLHYSIRTVVMDSPPPLNDQPRAQRVEGHPTWVCASCHKDLSIQTLSKKKYDRVMIVELPKKGMKNTFPNKEPPKRSHNTSSLQRKLFEALNYPRVLINF